MNDDSAFDKEVQAVASASAPAVPAPREGYEVPAEVLADRALSVEQKREILGQWASEVNDRLRAEEEGMSAQDPMPSREESGLAEEAAKVQKALLALEEMVPPENGS